MPYQIYTRCGLPHCQLCFVGMEFATGSKLSSTTVAPVLPTTQFSWKPYIKMSWVRVSVGLFIWNELSKEIAEYSQEKGTDDSSKRSEHISFTDSLLSRFK